MTALTHRVTSAVRIFWPKSPARRPSVSVCDPPPGRQPVSSTVVPVSAPSRQVAAELATATTSGGLARSVLCRALLDHDHDPATGRCRDCGHTVPAPPARRQLPLPCGSQEV